MSFTTNVFIVDDEQKAIDSLSQVLTSFFEEVTIVGTATNVKEAHDGILSSQPQLVFLDIEMGMESGFNLLESFDHIDFQVVFVTAHEEFALRAIKLSALDYIIKPAGIGDLKNLFKKIEQSSNAEQADLKVKHMFGNFLADNKNEHRITLPVAEGYEFIQVDTILFIKADGSYTHFFLKDGHKLTSSKNLKFFEGILTEYGFYRIHNSSLINLKYIKRINKTAGGQVIMENGEELGISKTRKEDFLRVLSLK